MLQQPFYQSSPFLPPDESTICQNSTKLPLQDAMEYEGARLSTFATFPDIPGIYATKLARTGFYYSGNGDEVVCFKCKITHKNWKRHDSPSEIHKLISPLCDFIKQNSCSSKFMEHSQNITEGTVSNGAYYSPSEGTECDKTKPPIKSTVAQQSLNMHTNGIETQGSENTNTINQHLNNFIYDVSQTYGVGIQSSPCGINQSLMNNTNTDITRTEVYQIANNYSSNNTGSLTRISQTNLSTMNCSTSALNSQILSQTTSNDSTIASKAPLEPMTMGICIDTPKYSKYATRISRLDSFKHWPTYLTQSPDEMVSAGFFFTGTGDHCRCFFCGGGLRNWEPGDQPWIEHARWYQNCAFVRNCKGERFIRDVQTTNMQTEIVEKNELPNPKTPLDDFRNIPSVRSVSQFGYDEKLIKEAYDTVKKAGTSDITSTVLLETIFNLEEKSNQTQENSNKTKPQIEETRSAIGPAATTQVNNEPASDPELELSVRSLEEENQNLKDQQTCKICLDEPIAIVFLPCGHLAACVTCAPALRRCPICRTFIKGTVKAIMC
ncbi:baculoviral IAP repeat-containing protein 7-A-like [Mytilus californianus]|uniref:baculoviral IAP repeat-containing protein 7-A-like n=1 Tax=Mytilus californianus TaxID=6549 RepID=UPI0022476824|nr:baculoviral IAP repeat-containing protein 7-A-like [Mytilus californianus]XP_052060987.1 baculoviral IAP repeat-containing protein 7-A-like [Mytilus californianus]XP_052060990.1 baculoviral IAP repeat-containing protein 7-A-like [Mytilus californianus]